MWKLKQGNAFIQNLTIMFPNIVIFLPFCEHRHRKTEYPTTEEVWKTAWKNGEKRFSVLDARNCESSGEVICSYRLVDGML